MKKAFTVCFPGNADSVDTDSDDLEGCDDADDDLGDSANGKSLMNRLNKMYIWP